MNTGPRFRDNVEWDEEQEQAAKVKVQQNSQTRVCDDMKGKLSLTA